MQNSFTKLAVRALCNHSMQYMDMMLNDVVNTGAIRSEYKSIIHIMKMALEVIRPPGRCSMITVAKVTRCDLRRCDSELVRERIPYVAAHSVIL
jgi:hypothetical protein